MMQKIKIGIITYDIPHLKTEQLLCNLICMGGGGESNYLCTSLY